MKAVLLVGGIFFLISLSVLSQGVQTPPSIIGPCWVIGVQDGDSITVRGPAEETIPVRYMGIDAPELETAFGDEAFERNRRLVEAHQVWLEVEIIEGGYRSDRDGRVLAYVFLDAARLQSVQQMLVSQGLALIDVRDIVDRDLYPGAFPIRRSHSLIRAQIEAARNRRGLWEDRVPETGEMLVIAAIEFWGEVETVYIVNAGEEEVDLAADWMLMDEHAHEKWEKGESSRNLLQFGPPFGPECTLPPGGVLMIRTGPGVPEGDRKKRTGCGTDEVIFNWSGYKVWDSEGDTAFLYSPGGSLASIYRYPWQRE